MNLWASSRDKPTLNLPGMDILHSTGYTFHLNVFVSPMFELGQFSQRDQGMNFGASGRDNPADNVLS